MLERTALPTDQAFYDTKAVIIVQAVHYLRGRANPSVGFFFPEALLRLRFKPVGRSLESGSRSWGYQGEAAPESRRGA